MLEGRNFTLFMDYKHPTYALFRVSPPWSARQQRHLSEFTSDLIHLLGPQNIVADAVSRAVSTFNLTCGFLQIVLLAAVLPGNYCSSQQHFSPCCLCTLW